MKPSPATIFSVGGLTKRSTCDPTSTPIPAAVVSASDAPANTTHRLTWRSEANKSVAT